MYQGRLIQKFKKLYAIKVELYFQGRMSFQEHVIQPSEVTIKTDQKMITSEI